MLSILEKLLISAYELQKNGRQPFTAEELVVSAWEHFPDAFGLAGFRNEKGKMTFPDSNRVFAEIMGSKPIRKRGYLVKVGSKMYQLTESGADYAKHLAERSGSAQIEKASLPRDIERELRRLLGSRAVEKFRSDRVGDITFFDLCAFLGISPRSTAIELHGRIANYDRIIEGAISVAKDNKVSFTHGGDGFGIEDLRMLIALKNLLLSKFARDLDVIKLRYDERS
jgi:hypothetical protein